MIVPKGCACEPGAWDPYIPPICDSFVKGNISEQCKRCGHDRMCHGDGVTGNKKEILDRLQEMEHALDYDNLERRDVSVEILANWFRYIRTGSMV